MNIFKLFLDLVKTGTSAKHFYRNMNSTLKRLNGEYTMLHYPMEGEQNQSFIQGQINLTDFCTSLLGDVGGLNLLEIGCGNGVQAKHILQTCNPGFMTGIDLDPDNIDIAREQQEIRKITNMLFLVDDAQELRQIASESMDAVISIESAFHYPDKAAFIDQVSRILKPGGKFLVADLLTTKRSKGVGIRKYWKGKMVLNHWNLDRYKEYLEKDPLILDESVDITDRIIRGFNGYRRWITGIEKAGLIRDFLFWIFYIINVEWILFLLRHRRKYLVFAGIKSE
ncbi:class I SAM-dependent methyltransferase [Bacteroidota bacterium]